MVRSIPPRGTAPARPNLEQQRKRAKELLRAYQRGEPAVVARVRRHISRAASALKLADAQHVVAREAGFESWARLKLHVIQSAESPQELLDSLLAAALAGHRAAVESALALAPALPRESLHVAAALADEHAVQAHLGEGAHAAVVARGGTLGGTPLAHLCHARLGREQDAVRTARARIAKALLAAGADPNECVEAPDTPGGKLSVLSAAARHAASPELVSELLAAGAVLEPPGSTAGPPAPPLVSAALGGSLGCVERLLAAGAPAWQAREALEVAIEHGDADMARTLLAYGCLPDRAGRWRGRNGGCLHAALALGRDAGFLRMLCDGGASVDVRDRDGRTPLSIAVQLNALDAAELLRDRGAADAEISAVDHLLGACFARDRGRVEALLSADPQLFARCTPSDHQNVCRAVRRGDAGALRELLCAGFDPDAVDDDGETALHLAVLRRDLEAIELLIDRGASPDIPNYDNLTARDLMRSEAMPELRSAMAGRLPPAGPVAAAGLARGACELSDEMDTGDFSEGLEARQSELALLFERAVDLMSAGDLAGLRELLDREPRLASARSHRFHRATLLHYLGNNGTERRVVPHNSPAIAELLLERGAAVDASCRMYGGGPHQTTLGLAASSDASVYPAGVLAELLRVLVRGGARVHEPDGRSRALEGAIEHGATLALRTLEENGARAYDLQTAAALGDLALLDARLPSASESERIAAFENAATFGQLLALERLLEAGEYLDAHGAYGATALHKAAAANCAESVRWLLEHGASAAVRDRAHGGTPEDWARHFGSAEALAALTGQR